MRLNNFYFFKISISFTPITNTTRNMIKIQVFGEIAEER
jgi:hypothetical protein